MWLFQLQFARCCVLVSAGTNSFATAAELLIHIFMKHRHSVALCTTSFSLFFVESSRESYQPKYNLHMVDYITLVVGNVEMWSNEFLGRRMCCFKKLICPAKFRLAFSRWCLPCANIVLASFSIPNAAQSEHASSISMQLYHWQQNVFTFFTAALLFRCRFLRNFIFFLLINPVVV